MIMNKLIKDVNSLEKKLKKEYMEKLFALCTDDQKDLFSRMYPEGVSAKKMDWATTQIENTLKTKNFSEEKLKGQNRNLQEENTVLDDRIINLQNEIKELTRTEVNVKLVGDEDMLNALIHAGVQKTEIWEYALELLEDDE